MFFDDFLMIFNVSNIPCDVTGGSPDSNEPVEGVESRESEEKDEHYGVERQVARQRSEHLASWFLHARNNFS